MLSYIIQDCDVDPGTGLDFLNLLRSFDHIVLRHDAALVLVHFQFFIKIIVAFFVFEPAAAPAGTVSVNHMHGEPSFPIFNLCYQA